MASAENGGGDAAARAPRARGLRYWFAGGFLLVFVGVLFLGRIGVSFPPSTNVVYATFWDVYLIGLSELFQSQPATLGGARVTGSILTAMVSMHLTFSFAAGVLASGCGWCVNRVRRGFAKKRAGGLQEN